MFKMSHYKMTKPRMLGVLAIAVTTVALLRDALGDDLPKLPEEAYASCEAKKAGDACVVRLRDMELTGQCADQPSEHRLFCRPEHPPAPPAAAFTACEGKKAADTCSVQFDGQEIQGSCIEGEGSRLVCMPDHLRGTPRP